MGLMDNRIISKDTIPPGEKNCNRKLTSRDGYCQKPGIAPFQRCNQHGGRIDAQSLDLFKKAVPINVAEKLQTLIEDTLSMDGELASGKTLLLAAMEDYYRNAHVIEQFQENIPKRPEPDASEAEINTYNSTVELYVNVLNDARIGMKRAMMECQRLVSILSQGVLRNSKIKEGSKFQLDAKQIAKILKVQLDVMAEHCKGCPKLRDVLKGIQEGTQDIPISPDFSRANKEAMGKRTYKKMVTAVNQIGEELYPIDEE